LHPTTTTRRTDDLADAACAWSQGEPWLGVCRAATIASAATVELIVPHEAGALAVPLWTPTGLTLAAAPREIWGAEVARCAPLEDFGVAARLTGARELALFQVAPSHALRLDDTGFAWGGGAAVSVRVTGELAEAVARAVRTTRWPPSVTAPRLFFAQPEAR